MWAWPHSFWVSGEIIDSDESVQELARYSSVADGYLDGHHIPEQSVDQGAITQSKIWFPSFLDQPGISKLLSRQRLGWRRATTGGTVYAERTVTMERPGVIEAHCSIGWRLNVDFPNQSNDFISEDNRPNCVGWRLLVDGVVVDHSPLHSGMRYQDATHLAGPIAVEAGDHTITLEGEVYRLVNNNKSRATADFVLTDATMYCEVRMS